MSKDKKKKRKLVTGDSNKKTQLPDEETTPGRRKALHNANHAAATREVELLDKLLSGRYRLKREIARGGMGIVYEAVDETLNNRPVAIKVLPDEMSTNEAAVLRLKKEALAAIELTHTNIMRLHSFEEDGHLSFLVMELLDGKNLEVSLAANEGPMELEEVLSIARQVVAGLSVAHAANIIHRDIKPANLMYKTVNGQKVLKIADFGIAHQIKDSMSRLTSTSSSLTPLYAAPEQIKSKKLDARCDQYSLAVTLYELLNGRPPFSGVSLEFQIMNSKPEDLEDVPAHINASIQKALSKDREDRFADCEQFLAALEGKIPIGAGTSKKSSSLLTMIFFLFAFVATAYGYSYFSKPAVVTPLPKELADIIKATPAPTIAATPQATPTPVVPVIMEKG